MCLTKRFPLDDRKTSQLATAKTRTELNLLTLTWRFLRSVMVRTSELWGITESRVGTDPLVKNLYMLEASPRSREIFRVKQSSSK